MAGSDTTPEGTKISELPTVLPTVTTAPANAWIVAVVNGITSKIRKSDLLS